MRTILLPAVGLLSVSAAWIALYGWAVFDVGNGTGIDWQLVEPAAVASGPHHLEVGPIAAVEPPDVLAAAEGIVQSAALDHVAGTAIDLPTSNRIVTSNGTVLIVQELHELCDSRFRPQLVSLRFDRSTERPQGSACITNSWWHDGVRGAARPWAVTPRLAADPGSERFASNVYCVWSDGNDENRKRIFFVASSDHGASWSRPTILSDSSMPEGASAPSIAVNEQGIVAVSWYQRPGTSEHATLPTAALEVAATAAEGWSLWVRVSLDGGASWLAGVRANELSEGRDVAAAKPNYLVANANGTFQVAWHDRHHGAEQLQTAAVEVSD